MAEKIGEFTCGNCDETVDLKKDVGGKFYYHCGCGQHFMRGKRGPDIVLSKGNIYGAEPPKPKPEPVTEKPPVTSPSRNVTESGGIGAPKPPPKPKPEPLADPAPEPAPRAGNTFFD